MLQQGIEHAVRRGCARVVRPPQQQARHHGKATASAGAGVATQGRDSSADDVRLQLKPSARECATLQLMTRSVDRSNDSFFLLYFRLATAAATDAAAPRSGDTRDGGNGSGASLRGDARRQGGQGKGRRANILAEVLGSEAVVGGLAHNDAVLLQPAHSSAAAGAGDNAGAGSIIGVVETQFGAHEQPGPASGGGVEPGMVRVKVLRRRVTGAAAAAMAGQSRWACVPLDNLTTCMRE